MAQQLNPGPGIEDILAVDIEEIRERGKMASYYITDKGKEALS